MPVVEDPYVFAVPSAINLAGLTDLDSAPPEPQGTGLEFVELGVPEQQPLTAATLTALGFRHTGNNREKPIQLWEQGDAKILVNTSPVGRDSQVGPHIAALAVGTHDPSGAFERGAYLHATVAAPTAAPAHTSVPMSTPESVRASGPASTPPPAHAPPATATATPAHPPAAASSPMISR